MKIQQIVTIATLIGLARAAAVAVLALGAVGAPAAQPGHLGSVVAEIGTDRVLHAFDANRSLAPASLTKLMSVYVLLEALESAEVASSTLWRVSANAAAQPPSRFGFRAGESVDVETALAAMVVASGNDAAMLVAEGLAGSEKAFVARMNTAARELGMGRTLFVNASGLPAPGQRTTARDMAVLARALWTRFPARGELFSRTSVEFAGRRHGTTNPFISSYAGASGMKTGFTCRAGYNLVASVRRARRHLVAVVMGAPNAGTRARLMRELLDRALAGRRDAGPGTVLDDMRTHPPDDLPAPPLTIIARDCLEPGGRDQGPVRWTIDVGVQRSYADAIKAARAFIRDRRPRLAEARAMVIPRFTGVDSFRSAVTGLAMDVARDTCLAFRETGGDCIIMDTAAAKAQLEQARKVRRLSEARARAAAGSSN